MTRSMTLLRAGARRGAFTLLELVVVIVILAVLAALVLPLYGRIQAKGYETQTISNMRQMGIALLSYAGDNNYMLPNRVQPPPGGGQEADKWPRSLHPYLPDLRIYGSPVPDTGGKTYKVADPQNFLNNKTNYTSYIYNGGNDVQPFGTDTQAFPRLNTISQASNVIMLGIPRPQANNFYMDFAEKNNDDILNKQAFGDGTPYIFCDGSLRTLHVVAKISNEQAPPTPDAYTDWLWLFDKTRGDIIQ